MIDAEILCSKRYNFILIYYFTNLLFKAMTNLCFLELNFTLKYQ